MSDEQKAAKLAPKVNGYLFEIRDPWNRGPLAFAEVLGLDARTDGRRTGIDFDSYPSYADVRGDASGYGGLKLYVSPQVDAETFAFVIGGADVKPNEVYRDPASGQVVFYFRLARITPGAKTSVVFNAYVAGFEPDGTLSRTAKQTVLTDFEPLRNLSVPWTEYEAKPFEDDPGSPTIRIAVITADL